MSLDMDYIVDILKEKEYLEHGKTVPRELLENLFNRKATHDITWTGPLMGLMDRLKKEGFFSTSRGTPLGTLRIMEIREYSHKAKNAIVSSYKKQKKNKHVLDKCNLEGVDDKDARSIYHVRNLIILHEHALKSVLHDL